MIRPTDTGKRKSFDKGIEQWPGKGRFKSYAVSDGQESFVAAVGKLQFDVLQFRLRSEYRVKAVLDALPYESSAWLVGDVDTFKPPLGRFGRQRSSGPTRRSRSGAQRSKNFANERNPQHDFKDMG